ncbi:hypothetical protein GLAREA_03386 [Glarea lozoyensis ATCC 20868]|uniref:Prion-inhibition and propagation HeLo domain-containing protein n=1 Tax=Glarea lozoyensis (strain ATCC 20868 / MF5171) TaxID=1116229 RepID=S3CZU4_GLAL2|nr:uncharacterized protein GLAREA_03386 [Glarea lozoyensis ATCC 20868]EPE30419.1 hypothetical protein GLAREA_03386 [Glarea lozoyensis ATCC 20868]
MEAIGVTLSVLPIFSVCLEYFQYFKTAQSFSFDSKILLWKLDFEHERFIIWGEKHGCSFGEKDSQSSGPDNKKRLLVENALTLIAELFKNTRYCTINMDTAALKRFKTRFKNRDTLTNGTDLVPSQPGAAAKIRWAVYDKNKFEVLIKDIRDLVTGLYEILPVPNKERDRLVLDDMRSLLPDTEQLKQVEIASEDLYVAWSEAASIMILASEAGSVSAAAVPVMDHPQSQAFVRQESGEREQFAELNKQLGSVAHTKFCMTLTPQCLSASTAVPCTPHLIEETRVLNSDFPSFTPEGYQVISSLGNLITDKINPKFPSRALEILEIANYEAAASQALAIESMLPAEDIKIYCSPCACAIRTALRISKERSTLLIEYTVRVDERLPPSCCSYSTLVDAISSLLRIIQLAESGQLGRIANVIDHNLLKYLDRQWTEKM